MSAPPSSVPSSGFLAALEAPFSASKSDERLRSTLPGGAHWLWMSPLTIISATVAAAETVRGHVPEVQGCGVGGEQGGLSLGVELGEFGLGPELDGGQAAGLVPLR